MPPHERFTNHLLETLNSSRQRFQEYVDRMKLEVDHQVEKYKETILVEEESYRIQQNELFSVQEELSSDEGVRQKRRTAEEYNRQLEEHLISLQNEIRIRERVVDGTYTECSNLIGNLDGSKGRKNLVVDTMLTFYSAVRLMFSFSELKEEERQTRIKAKDAMEHKARVEESKNTTIDDLTRGIINYKYLGFDFVKANGNGLRYVVIYSRTMFF
jgi:hypothetical protein